jgi:hypothetical protein
MDDVDSLKVLIESTEQSYRFNGAVIRRTMDAADAACAQLAAAENNGLRLLNAINALKVALKNLESNKNEGNR